MSKVTVLAGSTFGELVDSETLGEVQATTKTEWVIDSAIVFNAVVDDLRRVMTLRDKVVAKRKEATDPLDRSKKVIMDMFRNEVERLDGVIEYLRRLISEWQRKVALELELARKEAERLAEKEREDMRLLVAKLESEGRAKEADYVKTSASFIVPHAPIAEPEVRGVSSREKWVVEVTDLPALCAHIGTNPDLANLVEPNMQAIRKMASALNGNTGLPGVRATITHTPVVRKA